MFGALMDLTGIRSSAFMLMYGVVWVSLIWMYWTEVRKTQVMGDTAPASPLAAAAATDSGSGAPAPARPAMPVGLAGSPAH
jgi:nitrate/nitrite transporter NarK